MGLILAAVQQMKETTKTYDQMKSNLKIQTSKHRKSEGIKNLQSPPKFKILGHATTRKFQKFRENLTEDISENINFDDIFGHRARRNLFHVS